MRIASVLLNIVPIEGDCRVAVNTAPRNDSQKNVIASDSEAISCVFAPMPVEGDYRVGLSALLAMTKEKNVIASGSEAISCGLHHIQ